MWYSIVDFVQSLFSTTPKAVISATKPTKTKLNKAQQALIAAHDATIFSPARIRDHCNSILNVAIPGKYAKYLKSSSRVPELLLGPSYFHHDIHFMAACFPIIRDDLAKLRITCHMNHSYLSISISTKDLTNNIKPMETQPMLTIDPHAQFCCIVHGCRFGNNNLCGVAQGRTMQINKCGTATVCSEYTSHQYPKHISHVEMPNCIAYVQL